MRWVVYAPTPNAANGAVFSILPEDSTDEAIAAEVERAKTECLATFDAFITMNRAQGHTTYRTEPLTPAERETYLSRVEAKLLPTPQAATSI